MAKFSDIVAGTRALSAPETVQIAPDVSITVRFRPLAPFESSSVLSSARADAKAAGVDAPEAARSVHTIAFGLVDPDSDPKDPKPFFDGGPEQIRSSRLLTHDVIAYLYELWEQWSESCSLQRTMLDEAAFEAVLQEASIGNARPFFGLRPGARWNCFRTMAARLVSLRNGRSPSGSGSSVTSQPQQDQTKPAE